MPDGSAIRAIGEVDRAGVRIAVSERSAYDLYLTRTLEHAELARAPGLTAASELFQRDRLEALAGLRPGLLENAAALPGARVLDGRFTTVQQAIGMQHGKDAAAAFLHDFVEDAKASGLVARLIERHGVTGRLIVASLG